MPRTKPLARRRDTPASSSSSSSFAPSPPPQAKPRKTPKRPRTSVWTATDDFPSLIAASTLSTSSISARPPRPRGLQTLVKCAGDAAARGFRRVWEEEGGGGRWWKAEWAGVPARLKDEVRDGVFRLWGGYVTEGILAEVFIHPPHLLLPAHLLPCLATTDRLKPLRPPLDTTRYYTRLTLVHCPKASDVAIAGLIHHLENLEVVNLKGCTLAGEKAVDTIIKRCGRLKRLNLKGTRVTEDGVRRLLERFGGQLEGLKVGGIQINDVNTTFDTLPYPRLTHLTLPGTIFHAPPLSKHARAQAYGQTVAHPTPRPARPDLLFTFPTLSSAFPSLTHLSLPGLLLPPGTTISLPPNQLQSFKLGPGGPPVPVQTLIHLVQSQQGSLRTVHLGHVAPEGSQATGKAAESQFELLGESLGGCARMEDFRLEAEQGGSRDVRCDHAMARYSSLLYTPGLQRAWRSSLKKLVLAVPQPLYPETFELPPDLAKAPPLEHLVLASTNLVDTPTLAANLARWRNLRTLDLSGTTVTTEDVFRIVDGCELLSRVDLTSCRGVGVRFRRSVFEAWAEDRQQGSGKRKGVEEGGEEVDSRPARRARR